MDTQILVLRILHIATGVYWAGAVFFAATFLIGAVVDAGPAGGQVMAALVRRRYFEILPGAAAVTILSGLLLYYRISGHFDPVWMGSRMGITLGIGAVAAVVALLIGIFVARPATLAAGPMMAQAMGMADGPEKAAKIATVNVLRMRGMRATRAVAWVLVVTVLCMATARYL